MRGDRPRCPREGAQGWKHYGSDECGGLRLRPEETATGWREETQVGVTWREGPQTQPPNTWKRQTKNQEGPEQLGAFQYDLELGYYYRMGCFSPLGVKAGAGGTWKSGHQVGDRLCTLGHKQFHFSPKSSKLTDPGQWPR